jgi:hypothetical protein
MLFFKFITGIGRKQKGPVMVNTNTVACSIYADNTNRVDSGFASIHFLFVLMFVSALIMGVCVYGYSFAQAGVRARQKNMVYREIEIIIRNVIADMYSDPNPDINSPEDPLWAWNGKTTGNYRVTVTPLSDRLNLNHVRKNVFEKTNAGIWLNPGKTADEFQQFREDKGLSLSADVYHLFFDDEIIKRFFSCYGWANINLIDEFAARKLALSLTGSDQTAEQVRGMVQTLLINQQPADGTNLRTLFGIHYGDLFPFINTEPLINVNYAEPALLRALISYPDYGVSQPDTRCDDLLARRSVSGLGTGDILNVLGIDGANPLAAYLGSITWFWEITISGSKQTYRVVICRLPSFGQSEEIVLNIIEQGFQ